MNNNNNILKNKQKKNLDHRPSNYQKKQEQHWEEEVVH